MKREIRTYLIVDAKTGKCRVISPRITPKQLKSRLKPTEVPVDLTLQVDAPEQPILKAYGEIKLSQMQISNLILSEIEEPEETQKEEFK